MKHAVLLPLLLAGCAAPEATPEAAQAEYPVIIHDRNGCASALKGYIRKSQSHIKPNDFARSMWLDGAAGMRVEVYDSSRWRKNDDYAFVVKTDDQPVCVRTFEPDQERQWVRERGYRIWYSGGTNLDGKVSSIRIRLAPAAADEDPGDGFDHPAWDELEALPDSGD